MKRISTGISPWVDPVGGSPNSAAKDTIPLPVQHQDIYLLPDR